MALHANQGSDFGAGDETRTRDINLGKVALYQLSYSRSLLLLHCLLVETQMSIKAISVPKSSPCNSVSSVCQESVSN